MHNCIMNSIVSFMANCSLAWSAVSPGARLAVERLKEYECGVFVVTTRRTDADDYYTRCVCADVKLCEGQTRISDDHILDWWLLRQGTFLPIAYATDTSRNEIRKRQRRERSVMHSAAVLASLTRINVSGMATKLDWLHECPVLLSLDVSECSQITDFSAIGKCARLEELHMKENSPGTLEWIVGCAALKVLDVSRCSDVKDYSPIGHCGNLKDLLMNSKQWTRVSNVSWIGKLRKLTRLHMANMWCSKKSLDWIAECTLLEDLNMKGCGIIEDTIAIYLLPRLRHLCMDAAIKKDVEWTKHIATLEHLSVRISSRNTGVHVYSVEKRDYPNAKSWKEALMKSDDFKRMKECPDLR